MAKIDDVEIPTLLFDEQGSDPTTPASTFWRFYFKAAGLFHRDDAGAVTGPLLDETDHDALDHTGLTGVGGSGGGVVDFAEQFYTSGDIAVTATAAGTAVPSLTPLTLSGTAGDIVAITMSTRITDSDAQSMRLDASLTGSATRFMSSRTSTADALGVAGWFGFASTATAQQSGTIYIELVSADLSGGSTTVTMCAWLSGAGSRPLAAGTNGPLIFQAINLGQP